MPEPIVNLAAVEPLFAPHEEPNQHRARAQGDQPAQAKKGRRPSKIGIAQSLRSHVKHWRETDYPGASDTTRELLHHWFGRDHLMEAGGLQIPFRYYFCQREAIETLIYLYEVRGIRSLTPLMSEFAGPSAETAALGVNPDNDRWAKYAFKLATGAGKNFCEVRAVSAAKIRGQHRPPMRTVGARSQPVVIVGIHDQGQSHLVKIVQTLRPLRGRPGFGQRGQQQRRQDGNDRNDNQEFNQREPPAPWCFVRIGI
jgi:hypothetical protein